MGGTNPQTCPVLEEVKGSIARRTDGLEDFTPRKEREAYNVRIVSAGVTTSQGMIPGERYLELMNSDAVLVYLQKGYHEMKVIRF